MKTQIRNKPGMSSYWGGGYQGYGRYQWNIKFYGWRNEFEIESAQLWAFGDRVKVGVKSINGNTMYGFDGISSLLGRPIESSIEGRSDGWLVIDTELTATELRKVDRHVKACMEGLENFLKDERELNGGAQ